MTKNSCCWFLQITITLCLILSGTGAKTANAEASSESLQQQLQNLKIISEEYPPISFTNKDGQPDGLAVDIVKEIMRRLNMHQEIQIWPWARGYNETVKGPNFVLFSASRTEEREPLFHWVGELLSMKSGFYARKGSGISIKDLDDARKLESIGTTRENFDEQFLIEKGFRNLDPSRNNLLNIRKLMMGRFEVIVSSDITLTDHLKQAGYDRDDVEKLYSFLEVENYIVFSKQVPPEVVKVWQQTFEEIRDDGKLNQIKKKWLH